MKGKCRNVQDPDTIAAIATPLGTAGVGIIRVSGPLAPELGRLLFRPAHPNCNWQSHHSYHGDIVTADGQTILDEVLVTLMRKPHSFTGEDVLEISCHGNPLILQTILEQLITLGCRPARPGEFYRARFSQRPDGFVAGRGARRHDFRPVGQSLSNRTGPVERIAGP